MKDLVLILTGKRILTKAKFWPLLGSRQDGWSCRPLSRHACRCTGSELPWEGAHPQEVTQSSRHQHSFLGKSGLHPAFPKLKSGAPGETGYEWRHRETIVLAGFEGWEQPQPSVAWKGTETFCFPWAEPISGPNNCAAISGVSRICQLDVGGSCVFPSFPTTSQPDGV